MGQKQSRLERILERKRTDFERLARRASRYGYGSGAVTLDDYLQTALTVAVEIYRRHSRKTDIALEQMMYKGAVYSLWDTWRKEVTTICHTIELTTNVIDPGADVFQDRYVAFFFQEAEKVLTPFEYELLMMLVKPEYDVTSQLCYDLFKSVKHRAIQRGEFLYLALYFDVSVSEIQTHYYAMREKVTPILRAVA